MTTRRVSAALWKRLGLMGTLLLAGCVAHELPKSDASQRRAATLRHRPPWLGWIASDIDMLARCVEGLEGPAYVALVYHDDTSAAVVTTVDAYNAITHCGVSEGRVLVRQPGREMFSAYEGMPLFSLGAARPTVAEASVVEAVVHEEQVLGWIHWPSPERRTQTEDHAARASREF